MRTTDIWVEQMRSRLARAPLLRDMPPDIQQGILRGALIGVLLCLVMGGLFGSLNRGPVGAIVGAISGALLGTVLGGLVGAVMAMFYPQSEGRATIAIDVDNGAGRYSPGETISGYVEIRPQNTFRSGGGALYFVCRGQYLSAQGADDDGDTPKMSRHLRQYLLQQVSEVPANTFRRGVSLRYPFTVTVPEDGLPTHSGYACAIRWSLAVSLDGPGEQDIKAEQGLMVEAMPPAMEPSRAGFGTVVEHPTCVLSLGLRRAVCAEGDPIKVEVEISPLESFDASEIRAVLLRVEHTPEGDDHTVFVSAWDPETGHFRGERRPGGRGTKYVWLEDEARLGGPMHFIDGEPETLSCSLNVPAQWRPTLVSKDGETIWKVGVVMVREGHSDLRALHEVIVHTGVSQLGQVLAAGPSRVAGNPD